jgi:hypothetical protein
MTLVPSTIPGIPFTLSLAQLEQPLGVERNRIAQYSFLASSKGV